jgi:hypothetical protein
LLFLFSVAIRNLILKNEEAKMPNTIRPKKLPVNNNASVSGEVIPFLKQELPTSGYGLLQLSSDHPENDMLVLSGIVGQTLSVNMSYHTLLQTDDKDWLAVHTEGVSYSKGIIPYFALGCIIKASDGGNTRIFDGRIAAKILMEEYPELAKIVITYNSLANKKEGAAYPLAVYNDVYGWVLRYRAKVITNVMHGVSESDAEKIYRCVDEILARCVILDHSWKNGDLLFVNNKITLHDRKPFTGSRKMLRVRFDDTVNQNILY